MPKLSALNSSQRNLLRSASGLTDYYVKAGDGTDLTTEIQSALNAAGGTGGRVILRRGDYIIGQLAIPSNVEVIGEGWGTRLLIKDGLDSIAIVNSDRVNGNANIALRNLYIDGNNSGQTELGGTDEYGNAGTVDFRNVTGLTVESVVIENAWATGIELTLCEQFSVALNRINGTADDGIAVNDGCAHGVVCGNVLTDIGNAETTTGGPHGIEIQDSARFVSVVANTITNPLQSGISVDAHAGGGVSADLVIADNVINGAGLDGIRILGNSAEDAPARVTLSGNIVNGSADNGILVQYADDVLIKGNQVHGSGGQGVELSSANSVSVVGNFLKGNTGIGIFAIAGGPWLIAENTIVGTADTTTADTEGVRVNAGVAIIRGNRLLGGKYGVHVRVADSHVAGNDIRSPGSGGIYLVNASDAHVQGNRIDGTANGILGAQTTSCDRLSILGNTIRNCSSYGIWQQSGDDWFVNGNDLRGNASASRYDGTGNITDNNTP